MNLAGRATCPAGFNFDAEEATMADELDGMNMRNLRKLAGARGVSWKGLNKEQLLAALRGHADGTADAPAADQGEEGEAGGVALADLKAETLAAIAAEYGIDTDQPYADLLAAVGAAIDEDGLTEAAAALVPGFDVEEATRGDGADQSPAGGSDERGDADGGEHARTAAADAIAQVAAVERDGSDTQPILRQTASAWWCPRCDHSAMTTVDVCPGCRARRVGDEVVRDA